MLALYRLVAVATLAGVAGQFFLAGAGAFGATSYSAHRGLGVVLVILGGVGLLVAAASRNRVSRALALEIALVLQFLFGHLGMHHPWIGALHGLLAIGIAALASVVARGIGLGVRHAPAT